MKLNQSALQNRQEWEKAGIAVPEFDFEKVSAQTKQTPEWVHFGAGNIFRGFVAAEHQKLLESGEAKTGIIAAETFDYDIIEKLYAPHDNMCILVAVLPDGAFDTRVVAGVAEGVAMDSPQNRAYMERVFCAPSLRMVSFTITEKGYALHKPDGTYLDVIKADIENGPEKPAHILSSVVAMLQKRYQAGRLPLALVSMDNCSKNGQVLRNSVLALAQEWKQQGFVDDDFLAYLNEESVVAFPWTMIDKITPRPAEEVRQDLEKRGVEGMDMVVTSKNTYAAPFVNAESAQYLFIEENFPNGKFALDKTRNIWYASRQTVEQVETMKVTTCLNPLHTAIAIFGCLLGIEMVSQAMKDADVLALVKRLGYVEGLPVVTDPGVIKPKDFIDEVVNERLPNPFIPDTTARIATDTSMKVGVRFGETIKRYAKSNTLNIQSLVALPLAIAAWCRYLLGVDDNGDTLELSSDPRMDMLQEILKGVGLGSKDVTLTELLSNKEIFGSDLYQAKLGKKIEGYFNEMLAGPGAVRDTLHKYMADVPYHK